MLRDYQEDLKNNILHEWQSGAVNVVGVAPTGAGKTVLMSHLIRELNDYSMLIAHRQELVGQISLALAREGIYHNIIAPGQVIHFCVSQHWTHLNKSFYNRNSIINVTGVDTLIRRAGQFTQLLNRIKYWVIDEAHHCLSNNKWGQAAALLPNAKGLGVTATPTRSDNKSLHRDQGGVFDSMTVGPSMRELIDRGYLSEYKIYGPPQSIRTDTLKIGATGDYTKNSLTEAAHKSTITGDIVDTYMKLTPGKKAIVFTVDVKQANETADKFNELGIRAESLNAKTPDSIRVAAIRRFSEPDGDIDVLCNVDLFGEGFDVPAVEVVIMGRPTQSYGLYVQQFGRALRKFEGKTHGIIIDHVANVMRHGLPDAPREWSLYDENYGKRRKKEEDSVSIKTCLECFGVFEKHVKACPYCGRVKEPSETDRSYPERVDGDLIEFSPELLNTLRAAKEDNERPIYPRDAHTNPIIKASIDKRHREKMESQNTLRDNIALWAGYGRDSGLTDSEIYRKFYHRFHTDILTAQTYKKKETDQLNALVEAELGKLRATGGVVKAAGGVLEAAGGMVKAAGGVVKGNVNG